MAFTRTINVEIDDVSVQALRPDFGTPLVLVAEKLSDSDGNALPSNFLLTDIGQITAPSDPDETNAYNILARLLGLVGQVKVQANFEPADQTAANTTLGSINDGTWHTIVHLGRINGADNPFTLPSSVIVDKYISVWTQINDRLFMAGQTEEDSTVNTAPGTLAASTPTNSALGGNDRTALCIHDDARQRPEVMAMARLLTYPIGSAVMGQSIVSRSLPGCQPHSFNQSRTNAIHNAKGLKYERAHGIDRLDFSYTLSSGSTFRYFEDMLFLDWLSSEIESRLVELLSSSPKIPYTDEGIQRVVFTIASVLRRGGNNGGIDLIRTPEQREASFGEVYRYQITAPTRASVEASMPADINSAVLNGVSVQYYRAGHIYEIKITGAQL